MTILLHYTIIKKLMAVLYFTILKNGTYCDIFIIYLYINDETNDGFTILYINDETNDSVIHV